MVASFPYIFSNPKFLQVLSSRFFRFQFKLCIVCEKNCIQTLVSAEKRHFREKLYEKEPFFIWKHRYERSKTAFQDIVIILRKAQGKLATNL
jgi:hypothetical protein